MKTLVKFAVALTAVASCAAFAQSDSDADRARRQRNVDEVLARHHVQIDNDGSTQAMSGEHQTLSDRTHHIASKTRETTHKVAQSTRNFTHRQAEKMRDFSDRQDARYPAKGDHVNAKAAETSPS